MWKFIVDVVHDFVSSLQPDVGRGFLHVSNVFLLNSQKTPCISVYIKYVTFAWPYQQDFTIETVSPEGTFCDTVQVPSSVGDMQLI